MTILFWVALNIPAQNIKSCYSGNGQTSFISWEKRFPRSRADFSMKNVCLRGIMLDMVRKMVDLYDKKLKMRRIFFLLVADGGSSQVATRHSEKNWLLSRWHQGHKANYSRLMWSWCESKDHFKKGDCEGVCHGNKTRHGGYTVYYLREEHRNI